MAVSKKKVRDAYLDLVQAFPLRPIRSDEELGEAIKVIDSLLDRESLSPAEQDYLDVLSDLIEKYEGEEHPMTPVSDAALLRHLIEARGVTQTQLSKRTGIDETTLSLVLAGKRNLSRGHIGKITHYFGVAPGA